MAGPFFHLRILRVWPQTGDLELLIVVIYLSGSERFCHRLLKSFKNNAFPPLALLKSTRF